MLRKHIFLLSAMAAGAVSSGVACSSSSNSAGPGTVANGGDDAGLDGGAGIDDTPPVPPFQADPPSVYVAKVKNILVGLPPTEAEVAAVTADPTKLSSLIDGWMALPQYAAKMLTFFQLAFQQTQVGQTEFADQTPGAVARFVSGSTNPLLLQNVTESFARTALALAAEGRPFNEAISTPRFMMTPALMQFYAFLDVNQINDSGKQVDRLAQAFPSAQLTVEADQGPIPIADSINPASPNFMHWYNPNATAALARTGACVGRPLTYKLTADNLEQVIMGVIPLSVVNGALCGTFVGPMPGAQLTPSDFTTWKMVTIRQPTQGGATTPMYDLATLRGSAELVLSLPRVGFFSTPAFFANWQTNDSNQMRGPLNQSLIVATGSFIDGTDTTIPTGTPGLDSAHAGPGTACFACHATLDPLRSILSATYSWNFHAQDTASIAAQKGIFAYRGVTQPVATVYDFAARLASHPLFATAWAEKLCYYVDSAACSPDDPEFLRVVGVFEQQGLSWNVLVRELLASPLTTNAALTKTATDRGEIVAVSRRDHLCAALNERLGLSDVCGLNAFARASASKGAAAIAVVASGLPSDGYGRGSQVPVLPNQPTLFYRAALENICEGVASQVVDNKTPPAGAKQWSSQQPDAAIADFVSIVMALTPSDPRSAAVTTILKNHFTGAVASGAAPTDALRSTFTTACLSPSSTGIGM